MSFFVPFAFATTTITAAATTTIGNASFVPSTGVSVKATTDTNGTVYSVTAQHGSSDPTKGGVQWGATSGTSTILKADAVTTGYPTAPGTAGSLPTEFK